MIYDAYHIMSASVKSDIRFYESIVPQLNQIENFYFAGPIKRTRTVITIT